MSAHIRDDDVEPLMTTEETAKFLRVSESWLAKARMGEERASLRPNWPQRSLQQARASALAQVAEALMQSGMNVHLNTSEYCNNRISINED